jgi:hypothetical protein
MKRTQHRDARMPRLRLIVLTAAAAAADYPPSSIEFTRKADLSRAQIAPLLSLDLGHGNFDELWINIILRDLRVIAVPPPSPRAPPTAFGPQHMSVGIGIPDGCFRRGKELRGPVTVPNRTRLGTRLRELEGYRCR